MKGTLLLACWLPIAGCHAEMATANNETDDVAPPAAAQTAAQGLTRLDIPSQDPGPPVYARVTPVLNQFFHSGEWLAIPFYRDPACVPRDFNLLAYFDFPGPGGPGAFGCALLLSGFLLIEPNAPLGTFPRQAVLAGDAVPFWFVNWSRFEEEARDGVVTIADLEALNPLMGVAEDFHETLKPRTNEHHVVIQAHGTLGDGRSFQFGVNHVRDQTRSIHIRFRPGTPAPPL